MKDRNARRGVIHRRVRRKLRGSAKRPRLAVYRTLNHIYVQAIDDDSGRTIATASTVEKDLRASAGGNVAAAKSVGSLIGSRLQAMGLSSVVFDRGGYLYHGRIEALAAAARESGLQF